MIFRRRNRVPFVGQLEAVECGPASLAMILAFHGCHVPLLEIREACRVSRDGATALSLVDAAGGYGLLSEGLRIEPETIRDLQLPAIVYSDFSHFVVLEDIAADEVSLVDPGAGRLAVTMAEFSRTFTGIVLTFQPTPAFRKRPCQRPSLRAYVPVVRAQAARFGGLFAASLALHLTALALPLTTKWLLDGFAITNRTPSILLLTTAVGAATTLRIALQFARSGMIQALQRELDYALMVRFVRHLLSLPLAFFLLRRPGDLLQRVQANAFVRAIFGSRALTALLDAVLVLTYSVLMLYLDLRLATLVLALTAARVCVFVGVIHRSEAIGSAEAVAAGRESTTLVEALSMTETARAASSTRQIVNRFTHRVIQRIGARLQRRRLELGSNQTMAALQVTTFAILFLAGATALNSGTMTIGTFSAFIAMQGLMLQPVEALFGAGLQFLALEQNLRRLDDVLEAPSEQHGQTSPPRLRGMVSLLDVEFAYAADAPPTLWSTNLLIRPGEHIALVGASGAGKTTLARLIVGIHRPRAGRVLLDDVDLQIWDAQKLRRQIGFVPQEIFLFDDSVRANLCLGDSALSEKDMDRALELACVKDVVYALPEVYETTLGENGARLSGGERQRLCLARALVRRPSILLLDEATSALDSGTELRIQANLARLECTRITIAHRIATIRGADRVVLVDNGTITDQGSFEDLARTSPRLRELLQLMEA